MGHRKCSQLGEGYKNIIMRPIQVSYKESIKLPFPPKISSISQALLDDNAILSILFATHFPVVSSLFDCTFLGTPID